MRWFIAFFLHEMAFGLLSVFLPLYVILQLGGNLTDVGIMIAAANFVAVPSSFFWGYVCEKTQRYRVYILISFLAMAALLFVFSLTKDILLLIIIYSTVAIFHVAHEAPKNVLISESYSRSDWEHSFATYEALTEIGWLAGLLLGFGLSGYGLAGTYIILVSSILSLAAFALALVLVEDPVLVFERQLVALERVVGFAQRGLSIASKALDGEHVKERLKNESASIFCVGLLAFSLATSMLFTPLPVFFSGTLGLSQSVVFIVFIFSGLGGLGGYVWSGRVGQRLNNKRVLRGANLVRGALSLLLVTAAVYVSNLTLSVAVIALTIMGAAYGFFLISVLSLSMELIPEGKAGIFNALIGLGGAVGCYLGTYIAESYNFQTLFIISGIGFFLGYIAFKAYAG
jgi:MFS family permease